MMISSSARKTSSRATQNSTTTSSSSSSRPEKPGSLAGGAGTPPRSPSIVYQCISTGHNSPRCEKQSSNYYSTPQHSPTIYLQKTPSPTERIIKFTQDCAQANKRNPSPKGDKVFTFSHVDCQSMSSSSSSHVDYKSSGSSYKPKSPSYPKSPRSPRIINSSGHTPTSPKYPEGQGSSGNYFNFNIQPPPVPKHNMLRHSRQQYQVSKSGTKSSIEIKKSKHVGDPYGKNHRGGSQDHKVGSQDSSVDSPMYSGYRPNSLTSDSQSDFDSPSGVGVIGSAGGSADKPKCNIQMNPGYDDGVGMYSSSKSINESTKSDCKPIHRCRKSTSDLTDLTDDAGNTTTMTSLSRPTSPRRRGSMKGGLAYLASRRGSRDSLASNMSNVSNEDIGPLNFQNTVRGRQRRTSNFLELPVPDHIRPRVCSLPEKAYNPRLSDDLYRLRTFSITNKGGVINCGDSIINRRSRSNTSVNSTASRASNVSGERSPFDGSCCGSGYHTVDSTPVGSPEEIEIPKYRVVLLGDAGVGKTALVSQFMTSEYMNTYDASLDDEFGEKTVSVLLDGEESEMIFIDHPSVEMSVENSLSTYEPHACVVIYSVVNRSSFQTAEEILNYLWREHYTQEKSVIVVGNKADLARSRVIPASEGKALAVSRDCKFIETSSGIQHNVDELLVGILKQIRLRESRERKMKNSGKKESHKLHGSKTSLSLNIAREILQKICMNDISKSKSCENLHVL